MRSARGEQAVGGVLDAEPEALRVRTSSHHERNAAQVVDRQALAHPLEQAGDERHVEPELLAPLHESQQNLVRRRREGHDHLLDAVVGDDALEVPAGAEHREPDLAVGGRPRIAVEEADRPEAELGLRLEALRHQPADSAGADDERRAERLTMPPRLDLGPVESDPAGGEIDRRERPRSEALSREVHRLGRQRAQRQHGHGSKRRRGHDVAEVVEDVCAEARPVHPADGEGCDDQDAEEREPADGRGVDTGGPRTKGRRERRSEKHAAVETEPGE